ncbi:hypothetical protein E3P92_02293 [Wallemia ichthyophaga]|uniref:Uncharacterized protein n=2 Tax=Wallemia ichthyophaga TaxID=245174 RepID=A0A4T0F2U3_WALIC|nr:uncharacterized protein J056_003586 [Wallemia ichthyophaga EXF-994]TIA72387.1 hypothetical protein E3P91_02044 [Wallemia ichthyophaga]EOR01910.1 hypothetical protein J056_003586 [Wallemia ichthyophaga EXF-994]TIA81807.1 hypothetical protein E3P98_01848 [Wallemia ichthyophaga]TIA91161.1 hypothetical protein E3P97_02158 [Wallemia ichthyophaga]TIB00238.1 hypothetical protein E3P95_01784 [Wallemia ichthyophaga]
MPSNRIRPPNSNSFSYLVWKFITVMESEWGFAILEPWEKAMVLSLLLTVSSIILFSVLFYAPAQLLRLKTRLAYYLFGSDSSQKEIIAVFTEWSNVIRGVSQP